MCFTTERFNVYLSIRKVGFHDFIITSRGNITYKYINYTKPKFIEFFTQL